MGIVARIIDSQADGKEGRKLVDIRVAPTHGGAVEFTLGAVDTYERLVVKHEDLDEVIDFCDATKKLALDLKAIPNPK